MTTEEIKIPEEFADICPFNDAEFHSEMVQLVKEPLFEHAVRFVMPDVDYSAFIEGLLQIHNKEAFQLNIMRPFLEMLEAKTTQGVSSNGIEHVQAGRSYTFITNHRDIVLDASFLNLCLIHANIRTTEIAIGNNLLIYDWISVLVRLNKSFIVKRDVSMRQTLEAAQQLSNYIHFAITKKNESVWIAQRQGRSKDSDDKTQESLIKMLAMGGNESTPLERLKELNLMPVSICYEYDPNDYLKAKEFLMKKNDPAFKKSQRDDLFSMETGLLQNKGQVNFAFTPCVNEELDKLPADIDRVDLLNNVCKIIDKAIHKAYKLYRFNYIAYDLLNVSHRFDDLYTRQDVNDFEAYINNQLSKVDIPVNDSDKEYMRHMMLVMYSNPTANYLSATE